MQNDKKNFDNQLELCFTTNQMLREKEHKKEDTEKQIKILTRTLKVLYKEIGQLSSELQKDLTKLEIMKQNKKG
jgi:hypothetical protein